MGFTRGSHHGHRSKRFLARALVVGPAFMAMAASPVSHGARAAPENPVAANSQPVRTDTPSGFPVPRFVSLKSNKTNCRIGPSLEHPRLVTFEKKGLPVRVIAETVDHWRKIEDRDGEQCWVHATLISGRATALVKVAMAPLRRQPHAEAAVRARLGAVVIVRVQKCVDDQCRVEIDRRRGWIHRGALWGNTR